MLTILSLVFSNWKAVLYGAAIGAALGWLAYEHHKIYAEGVAAANAQMEKANAQAKSAADAAQATVDACYARGAGFTWDRAGGVCHSPVASKSSLRRHN